MFMAIDRVGSRESSEVVEGEAEVNMSNMREINVSIREAKEFDVSWTSISAVEQGIELSIGSLVGRMKVVVEIVIKWETKGSEELIYI